MGGRGYVWGNNRNQIAVVNLGVRNRSHYFHFVYLMFFKFAKMERKEILRVFNEGETGKRLGGRFQIQTSGRASRGVRRTRAVDRDRSLVCFVFPCPVSPPPDSLQSLQGLCSPPLDSVVVELSPRCSTLPWPKLHGQSDPFSQDFGS